LEKIVLLKTDVFAVVICDHVVDIVVSQLKIVSGACLVMKLNHKNFDKYMPTDEKHILIF